MDAGVAAVMSAYNSVNGEWCGQNRTPAHRDPAGRVGLRRLRHVRLHLGSARPGRLGGGRARPGDAVRRSSARGALPAALASGRLDRADVDRAAAPDPRDPAAVRRRVPDTPRPAPRWSPRPSTGRWPARSPARSMVLLRNEPVDGRPLLPLDRATLGRSRWSAGWPTCPTPATTAPPTYGRRRWLPRWPACGRRCPGSTFGRRPGRRGRRRRGRGGRLHRRGRGRVRRLVRPRAGHPLPAPGRPGRAGRARPGLGRRTAGGRRRPRLAAAAPAGRAADPHRRRREPAHGRGRRGRRRGDDGGLAARGAGDPAGLVLGDGGRRGARRRAARRPRARRPAAVRRPAGRGRPAAVRQERHHGDLRPVARAAAARPDRHAPRRTRSGSGCRTPRSRWPTPRPRSTATC